MVTSTQLKKLSASFLLFVGLAQSVFAEHQHKMSTNVDNENNHCQQELAACSPTITSAIAPNGDLWRAWLNESILYLDKSIDNGKNYSPAIAVTKKAEDISARGENRPKLGFDNKGGIYLSWAMSREQRFTADIRLSYSTDYGKSFSEPVTINDDKLLAGHSFNEMLVSPDGKVTLIWLDSRDKKLAVDSELVVGSSIYSANGNPRLNDSLFANKKLIGGTCQCCRLAMSKNAKQETVIMWRHIFGDNIREFAVLTLDDKPIIKQISHDEWQIDGCPHQGGALAIDNKNRYHMVWFNAGNLGKGVFYGHSDDQGKTINHKISVGQFDQQAAHPHVNVNGNIVDIVWTQFDGKEHQLMHQQSLDAGVSFKPATTIATTAGISDRPFILTYKNARFVSWHQPNEEHLFEQLP